MPVAKYTIMVHELRRTHVFRLAGGRMQPAWLATITRKEKQDKFSRSWLRINISLI
jgi:hypothetical protein